MLRRNKTSLFLFAFGTALLVWGAMSMFPNTSHAAITGFTTNLDIKLTGILLCDDGSSSGALDPFFSGKGSTIFTLPVTFGTGGDAGKIEGTGTIDWGFAGSITYTFEGDSLAGNTKKGFFQLTAESAGSSDLVITGNFSLTKDLTQIQKAFAIWQGKIKENGFDCFGTGKVKAKIQK